MKEIALATFEETDLPKTLRKKIIYMIELQESERTRGFLKEPAHRGEKPKKCNLLINVEEDVFQSVAFVVRQVTQKLWNNPGNPSLLA